MIEYVVHEGRLSMPFPHQGSRPFNRRGIEAVKPSQNGLYGLFNAKVYGAAPRLASSTS